MLVTQRDTERVSAENLWNVATRAMSDSSSDLGEIQQRKVIESARSDEVPRAMPRYKKSKPAFMNTFSKSISLYFRECSNEEQTHRFLPVKCDRKPQLLLGVFQVSFSSTTELDRAWPRIQSFV